MTSNKHDKVYHVEEKKKEEEEYRHRHIDIDILSKNISATQKRDTKRLTKDLHIYVPQNRRFMLRRARELADREGRSLSRIILDQLDQYVRLHYPGNPQLPLTKFATPPAAPKPTATNHKKGELQQTMKSLIKTIRNRPHYVIYPRQRKQWLKICKENRDLPEAIRLQKMLESGDKE